MAALLGARVLCTDGNPEARAAVLSWEAASAAVMWELTHPTASHAPGSAHPSAHLPPANPSCGVLALAMSWQRIPAIARLLRALRRPRSLPTQVGSERGSGGAGGQLDANDVNSSSRQDRSRRKGRKGGTTGHSGSTGGEASTPAERRARRPLAPNSAASAPASEDAFISVDRQLAVAQVGDVIFLLVYPILPTSPVLSAKFAFRSASLQLPCRCCFFACFFAWQGGMGRDCTVAGGHGGCRFRHSGLGGERKEAEKCGS